MALNKKYYIRFGEIPENEESSIYKHRTLIGHEVGVGTDGEPLLKNVKILKDLTNIYYE